MLHKTKILSLLMLGSLKKRYTLTYSKECKIDNHAALIVCHEYKASGSVFDITEVYVTLPSRIVHVSFIVPKGNFAEMKDAIDSMIKSIKITEPKKTEAK